MLGQQFIELMAGNEVFLLDGVNKDIEYKLVVLCFELLPLFFTLFDQVKQIDHPVFLPQGLD